jgi:cytochrome b561
MALRNTMDSYGSVAKFFHWLIALLVIGMIIVGFSMGSIEDTSLKSIVYNVHKSTGLTVLVLMVLRLLWRLINPTPQLPATTLVWQKIAARTSHFLLYLVLIIMPLSGWIMSTAAGHPPNFWWIAKINCPWVPLSKPLASFFSEVHTALAFTIATLVVIHFCGAMKHFLIDRDHVLQRMWFDKHKGNTT